MARIILLDSGPLGLISRAKGKPEVDHCLAWLRSLDAAGVRIVLPEVTDYELRRELIRLKATAGLRRLDTLATVLDYAPITTAAMRLAADYWALVRRMGRPTAHPEALDADCILAGQAALIGMPDDAVTIATNNVGHFGRFPGIDAREWTTIVH